MRLPTTKQLQYFVALVDTEHFGRAAEQSHVSQSAFSTAIRELETSLGAQLVDRTNRQVTITAVGQAVATQARLCLRDLEELVDMAGGERPPLSTELQLGVIPTIAPFVLPEILPGIRDAYPDLKLFLTEDQSERLIDKLNSGILDVLLIALPYDMKSVDTMELFDDPFMLAYREGTERIDPDNFRLTRLEADSVLLLEDGHCLRDQAMAACRLKNLQKIQSFSASSLLTLVEMVDADLGVTFLPAMSSDSAMLKSTSVALHPVTDGGFRTIALAWRKGSGRAEEFRLLGEFIRNEYPPAGIK